MIGGLVLVLLLCACLGWIFYTTSTAGIAPSSSPAEPSDQPPIESEAAPEITTAEAPEAPADPTAQLEAVGNAIDEYQSELQKYPDSLAILKEENPELAIPPSFNYGTDAPLYDLYSLCTLTDSSQQYECVSSELGGGDPFTFPSASVEAYSYTQWQALTWQSATKGEDDVTLAYPPDWNYSTSSYKGDLTAKDAQGNTMIIGRFNLLNWQMQPMETFSEFEQENEAESTAQISSTTQSTLDGFPVYEIIGTDKEGNQTYDLVELLIQQNTYVLQLDVFVDGTISDYFDSAIRAMWGSINITPAKTD